MKQKILRLLCALAIIGLNLWPLSAQAAGASISLEASKATVASGSTVVIAIYMNGGGTPINAVESDINYSASDLQYVGISYSGSAFTIAAPNNGGGGGLVTIGNGTTSSISGSGLIATVTFRALVNSGSADFGVAGSSSLVSASNNSAVPFSAIGTSVRFGSVASAPEASSDNPSASAPAAVVPAPPKNTTPPVLTDVKATQVTPFGATITWTTNEPSDSEVDYGLDTTYGLSASSASLTTAHSVALSSAFLTPETLFHYHVKSTDADGNVATSADQNLNLPGIPITVVVVGPNGKPQPGAQVTLDGSVSTTDAKGSATLTSGLGNKKITTSYDGVTVEQPITVTKTAEPLPPIQLDLSKQPLNHWMLTSIGLVVVVLTLLGIDALLFGSHFFAKVMGLKFKTFKLAPNGPSLDNQPNVSVPIEPLEAPASEVTLDNNKTVGELMDLSSPSPLNLSSETLAQPLNVRRAMSTDVIQAPVPSAPQAIKIPVTTKPEHQTAPKHKPKPHVKKIELS